MGIQQHPTHDPQSFIYWNPLVPDRAQKTMRVRNHFARFGFELGISLKYFVDQPCDFTQMSHVILLVVDVFLHRHMSLGGDDGEDSSRYG